MEDKKKINKKKIIVISLLLLGIVLIGTGYFIYDMTYTDNNGEDQIEEDIEELLYTLDVYKNGNYLCLEKNDTCTEIAFTIKTKNENSKVMAFDSDKLFVLYQDGDLLRYYNRSVDESTAIELESTYKSYEIYSNNAKDSISGIIYTTNDDKKGYFNVSTGKKLYEGKYILIRYLDENYLNSRSNEDVYEQQKSYLLSTNEEKVEMESGKGGFSYNVSSYEGKYYYILEECFVECTTEKIYSNDKKVIIDKTIQEQNYSFNNDNLYVVKDNIIQKYNIDGELVSKSKEYFNIKGLINNYVIYINNNKLILENIDTEESKELVTWNDKYYYDEYSSKYYTRLELDNMGETDKEEGLYVVINYQEKDKNGNYGMEYCLTSDNAIKTYPITKEIGGRAKPVLYLYPTETTNVKVEFEHPEYLTTTYPKYEDSWKVIAHPNGDLYDKNNKYYYALYWDEIRYNEVDFKEGFYVESNDAINFLEEKLNIIGLNDKERNEFIMYWLPILESNKKSLVYFELTEERELGNKLIITPKPDSMLRVSIHIKKVNNKIDIRKQNLETFERHGFTAIEWGGMVY
ncbi:MAG: hypothetical protein IKN63_01605 [Bacilli bacterium]|nr:hypothetical protein [Bacilli bacterium]